MAVEHHSEPAPEITPQAIRQIIETEIERLIGALDFFDPDPDLENEGNDEDNGDGEPSLGSLDANSQSRWSMGTSEDYDLDEADDEDGGDGEPSLGSLSANIDQDLWGRFCTSADYEQDDADKEPSLGSLNNFDWQTMWGASDNNDCEDEHDGAEPCCEDEGAQCDDEGINEDREPEVDAEGPQHPEFADYWRVEQELRASQSAPMPEPFRNKAVLTLEEWHAARAMRNGMVLVPEIQ